MNAFRCLIFTLLLLAGGRVTVSDDLTDAGKTPMRIGYSALKTSWAEPDERKKDFEYHEYAVVKKYADDINSAIPDLPKSKQITLLLSVRDLPLYATPPDYELLGTDLFVHVARHGGRFEQQDMEKLEPGIKEILLPLAEKLGGEPKLKRCALPSYPVPVSRKDLKEE